MNESVFNSRLLIDTGVLLIYFFGIVALDLWAGPPRNTFAAGLNRRAPRASGRGDRSRPAGRAGLFALRIAASPVY